MSAEFWGSQSVQLQSVRMQRPNAPLGKERNNKRHTARSAASTSTCATAHGISKACHSLHNLLRRGRDDGISRNALQ
eukprot:6296880-Alexandrium_andersonii.AAC.1